jgi:LmbE family N-acetylglucosaminyl deacetylase
MMTSLPTLVCVHAHPDDEAFFGAGAVARYAERGHRVVLVTCTNGQLGFDPAFLSGESPDHDALTTKSVRAGELQRAATMLGYSRLISLGYDDSGMEGWPQNQSPSAFVNADVDASARTLAAIFDEEKAKVVMTYDENGFYGHPDHIRANVITRRALELSTSAERLYYPVVPKSIITNVVEGAKDLGLTMPTWVMDAGTNVPDELVATSMDVSEYAALKQKAMATHASQVDNGDLVGMKQELFTLLFGIEYYQRAWSRHDVSGDATDLFGGM